MEKSLENKTLETFNPTDYLKGLHTKQLIKLRDKIYQTIPSEGVKPIFSSEEQEHAYWRTRQGLYDVSNNFKNWYVDLVDVKKELATREHIPNKAEAKEIRQNRAKNKMR